MVPVDVVLQNYISNGLFFFESEVIARHVRETLFTIPGYLDGLFFAWPPGSYQCYDVLFEDLGIFVASMSFDFGPL